MEIKDIDSQKEIFKSYTDEFIKNADEEKKYRYIDKQNHSIFVLDEALLTDALFTEYNPSFKNLLALESLFHDIGRFEQLEKTGTFRDVEMSNFYIGKIDHGDLGAEVIDREGLLKQLIPDIRLYDDEVKKVIRAHSKINPELLDSIILEYIEAFRNYDLRELFLSDKASSERKTLLATNTAIIQDVDRLDIFRKIVKGIWTPMATDDKIDPMLFELFKQGKLPSMQEIKNMRKWNANVGHLVRLSFINQMNLVPVLLKVRNENLIEKVYETSGNEIVRPAYELASQQLDDIINSSDGIIRKK